ncbi:MAG TPA: hypothetical protein VFQ38_14135 [Longimicrobiales bacterium]|nr:hypothetical protein [Longimicrobiales bacterium]
MATGNDRVLQMVREEIERNPAVRTDELFDRAKKLDKSVAGMSIRQFHARYPLQIKRMRAALRPRRRARPRRQVDRGAVRTVLLELARDLMGAQDKARVVEVIGGLDGYVDRVVKAAGL